MSTEQRAAEGTTFVIGDIGGQLDIFEQSLRSVGVNTETMSIPEGVTVVQLGDVIRMHDSPHLDNLSVLALVNGLRRNNPGRYIQLWGNHEYGALHFHLPGTHWRVEDRHRSALTAAMQDWLDAGRTDVAVAVGDTLITHAGLTHGYWQFIGSPNNAADAADALNLLSRELISTKARAPYGYILNRYTAELDTNVLWAEAATETYPSWLVTDDEMPFNQVHGHDTPYSHEYSRLKPHTPRAVAERLSVDKEKRRTVFRVDGRTITCVDWTLGEGTHQSPWEVLSLEPNSLGHGLLTA
jgi:hypothetical protein